MTFSLAKIIATDGRIITDGNEWQLFYLIEINHLDKLFSLR